MIRPLEFRFRKVIDTGILVEICDSPMELPDFNRMLILSALLITVAAAAVVSGRLVRDRMLAIAIMVQGIVMTLVAASAYFPRPELELAAAAILLVLPLWMAHVFRRGSFRETAIPGNQHAVSQVAPQSLEESPLPTEIVGESE